jgi:hypothetical protein
VNWGIGYGQFSPRAPWLCDVRGSFLPGTTWKKWKHGGTEQCQVNFQPDEQTGLAHRVVIAQNLKGLHITYALGQALQPHPAGLSGRLPGHVSAALLVVSSTFFRQMRIPLPNIILIAFGRKQTCIKGGTIQVEAIYGIFTISTVIRQVMISKWGFRQQLDPMQS